MPDAPRSADPAPEHPVRPDAESPAGRADATPAGGTPADVAGADEGAPRHTARNLILVAVAVVIAVTVVVLGITQPKPSSAVSTDRLGPLPGQQVTEYLAQAQDSLQGTDTDPHWALVSFDEPITPARIPEYSGGLRIAGVVEYVAIDRVQTPVITVATPAGDAVAMRAPQDAANLLAVQPTRDERTAAVARVVTNRLRAGCACTVGLIVRGTLPELRALADRPGVRSVQALPADAIAGRFAVAPLLPGTTDVVSPTPDDGPVPAE
ncbi:hypothetical protein ACWEVD_23870 [Nocardia thailandica]